jgi:hypothetical protein
VRARGSDVRRLCHGQELAAAAGPRPNPRRVITDHRIASRRQQAHTRKRVPIALPRTCGRTDLTATTSNLPPQKKAGVGMVGASHQRC